jgi:hypothetical protein
MNDSFPKPSIIVVRIFRYSLYLTTTFGHYNLLLHLTVRRDSSVGIMTRYELDGAGIESRWGDDIFYTCPDRPWGPPSLLYSWYQVFSRGKAVGTWCWPSPHLAPRLKKEQSYTSIPPLSLRGMFWGDLRLYFTQLHPENVHRIFMKLSTSSAVPCCAHFQHNPLNTSCPLF